MCVCGVVLICVYKAIHLQKSFDFQCLCGSLSRIYWFAVWCLVHVYLNIAQDLHIIVHVFSERLIKKHHCYIKYVKYVYIYIYLESCHVYSHRLCKNRFVQRHSNVQ